MSRRATFWILVLAGLATRLAVISHPDQVVWDESHYGRQTGAYLQGRFYFDVHPPLGKLILWAPLAFVGADPGDFSFPGGQTFPDGYPYALARVLPALAGSLLPALVYLLARVLGFSKGSSIVAGVLLLADTATLGEAHVQFIDLFVPTFGVAALLLFFHHRKRGPGTPGRFRLLFASAAFAMAAVSVKWTGAGAAALIVLVSAVDAVRSRDWREFLLRAGVVGTVIIVGYTMVFALHFHLLPRTGPGVSAMKSRFRASLEGTPESKRADIVPKGFWGKYAELNRKMWRKHTREKYAHRDSSTFLEWPLGRGRIWFWGTMEPHLECILMIANPVVWWFGTVSVIAAIVYRAVRRRQWREWRGRDPDSGTKAFAFAALLAMYFVNYLPFVGISRSMFIYHYFSALIASLLLGALFWFEILPAAEGKGAPVDDAPPPRPALFLLAFSVGMFLFLSPVTYGYRPRFDDLLRSYLSLEAE